MGVVRTEHKTINGITYTTTTFPASMAFDLYAELTNVIPEEMMKLIMLPVSQMVTKQRKGELDPEAIDTQLKVSMKDLIVTLETPGILAKIIKTVMRDASDIPGGLSSLMRRILKNTSAMPLRIEGFEGDPSGEGKGGNISGPHFDGHFGGDLEGMKEAIQVCVWVVRLNLGKASSVAA